MNEREFCEYCLGLADYLRRIIPESELKGFMSKTNQQIKTSKEKQAMAFALGIDVFFSGCRYSNALPEQDFKPNTKIIHFPIRVHRKRKREELKAMCKEEYIY